MIVSGATCEVFHVKRLACRLLRTLPFLAGAVRALVRQQDATLTVRDRPAELLALEYNVTHVFIEPALIYPIERHQCDGVLARYRLPACFLEHVERQAGKSNLKARHTIGFPS